MAMTEEQLREIHPDEQLREIAADPSLELTEVQAIEVLTHAKYRQHQWRADCAACAALLAMLRSVKLLKAGG